MATSDYKLSKFLLKIIILTYCGHVVPRSIPSRHLRHHNTPAQFPYPLTGSLPVQPIYYNPIPQVYQHQIEPTGTFYDRKRGILRAFPGGGIPLLVDYQKRCSNNYVGVKPHPHQNQYYYVCKPDCVVFGKCQNLQAFDGSKGQCSPFPQPEYTPVCKQPGRFPIPTDCTTYYRCDTQLRPQIFSCPRNTIFSPHEGKCICDAKCSPTIVSPYGTYIPQDCVHKFPPCVQDGTFRTPTDCSLYYTCAIQPNRIYLQTRYRLLNEKLSTAEWMISLSRFSVEGCILSEYIFNKAALHESIFYSIFVVRLLSTIKYMLFISRIAIYTVERQKSTRAALHESIFYSIFVVRLLSTIKYMLFISRIAIYTVERQKSTRIKYFEYLRASGRDKSIHLQLSRRCPELTFFDTTIGVCRPQHEVACDAIQLSELVYPRQKAQPRVPVVYPPHYSLDSLEDNEYSTENSMSYSKEESHSVSVASIEDSYSRETNNEVVDSSRETMYPRLPDITQDPTEPTTPSNTYSPRTIPYPTTTPSTSLTDYTTMNTFVGTENPLYTITYPTDNTVSQFPSTQITLPPPDHVNYIRHPHRELPYHIKNTLDETDLRSIRSSVTQTPTEEQFFIRRKGHLRIEDFKNIIDTYKLDLDLPKTTTTQSPVQYRTTNHVRYQTTEEPNKIILPTIRDNIVLQETISNAVNEHAADDRSAQFEEPEGVLHEMQSNETLDDVSYYEDDTDHNEVSSGTQVTPIEGIVLTTQPTSLNDVSANVPTDHINTSQSSSVLDDQQFINNEASQLPSPLEADDVNETGVSPTTNPVGEKVDTRSAEQVIPLEKDEEVVAQEMSSPAIDPTPKNLVREKLGEEIGPPEGSSPTIDPKPASLNTEKLDVADKEPKVPVALGEEVGPQEASSSSIDTTPTNLVREKLDAKDEEPEVPVVLGKGIAPPEGTSPTPTNIVTEKLDATDEDPEVPTALGEEIDPQEGTSPIPTNLVREKLEATDEDPEVPVVLGEEIAPEEGSTPTTDPKPTNLVREKLDATDGDSEVPAALGEEVGPQEGSSPTIDPTSTNLNSEKLDLADKEREVAVALSEDEEPEVPVILGEQIAPQEGTSPTPTTIVREKLEATDEDPEVPVALGEEISPQEGSTTTTDPAPTNLVTEKLDATDEALDVPAALGEEAGPQEGSLPSIDSTPTNLPREKLDATDENPEVPVALGEEVTKQDGFLPSVDSTPTNLIREKLDATDGDSEVPATLGKEVGPQEGSSPSIDSTSTNLPTGKLDAINEKPEVPVALGEGSLPSIDQIPTILDRQKLDATDENPEAPAVLGEEIAPQDGSSPTIDQTPVFLDIEKLDVSDGDPEVPPALRDEIGPQVATPPNIVREKLDAPNEDADVPVTEIPQQDQEKSSPTTDPAPPNLVREKLDATDAGKAVPVALAEQSAPQEGSSPTIETTPTSPIREVLDARDEGKEDETPEVPAVLGEEIAPQEGSSPTTEETPAILDRKKFDVSDGDPEAPDALSDEIGPQVATPSNLVREKLDAPNEDPEVPVTEIAQQDQEKSSPTTDPTPPNLITEKLDATDAGKAVPVALAEESAPQEGSSPTIETTPTKPMREVLETRDEGKEDKTPKVPAVLGEEIAPQEGSSKTTEETPAILDRKKLDVSDGDPEAPDALSDEIGPQVATPSNLVREKLDAPDENPEVPVTLGEKIAQQDQERSSPTTDPTPPNLVIEKMDATDEGQEVPVALAEESAPQEGSSPTIKTTPTNLIREKLDETDAGMAVPVALGEAISSQAGASPISRSSLPIEASTGSLSIEKLDALNENSQIPLEEEGSALTDDLSPPIESTPTTLIREKLDAEIPPTLGEENRLPKGSSPPFEPNPTGLIREKLDADPQTPLGSADKNVSQEINHSESSTENSNNMLEDVQKNTITYTDLGWNESQIKYPQIRVVKSVTAPKDSMNTLPSDDVVDLRTRSTKDLTSGNQNAKEVDFETRPDAQESLSDIANIGKEASMSTLDITEDSVLLIDDSTATSFLAPPIVTEPTTEKRLAQTDVESSTKFIDIKSVTEHQRDAEDMNSMNFLPTTESIANTFIESFGAQSEIPASMENEISQNTEPHEVSTSTTFKWIVDISPSSEKTVLDEHNKERIDTEHTTPNKPITERKKTDTVSPDTLITDVNPITFRPIRNAILENNFEDNSLMSNLIDIGEQPTASRFGDNDVPVKFKSFPSTENIVRISAPQAPVLLSARKEDTISSSTKHAPQLADQLESSDINEREISLTVEPTIKNSFGKTKYEVSERSDIPQELEEETGTRASSLEEKGKESKQVFNLESSTADAVTRLDTMTADVPFSTTTEISNSKSSTDTIMNTTNSADRDSERPTSTEHIEKPADTKSEDFKARNCRPLKSDSVIEDETNESERTTNHFSNILEKSTVKNFDEQSSTVVPSTRPFEQRFTAQLESTTKDIDILSNTHENSLINTNMGWSEDQTESSQIRVVKAVTELPPTMQRELKSASEIKFNSLTHRPTLNAEIGKDLKQENDMDFRIPPIVSPFGEQEVFEEAFNFMTTEKSSVDISTNTAKSNTNILTKLGLESNEKDDLNNFAEQPTHPTELAGKSSTLAGDAQIPAGVLERATGLIKLTDSSHFIKPIQLQTANLIAHRDALLLPINNDFTTPRPTTDPINTVNEIFPEGLQDLPTITAGPLQRPFELVPIPHTTTTTFSETTTEDIPMAEITGTPETATAQTPLTGIQFHDNFVDATSDNVRIVRYTKDTTQYPQAIRRVYRQNPVYNTNFQTVTEIPVNATDVPKMEVVVFGDLDLSVLFCANECNSTHEHKFGKNALGEQHAVGVQWDPVNSNKTMSLVTV